MLLSLSDYRKKRDIIKRKERLHSLREKYAGEVYNYGNVEEDTPIIYIPYLSNLAEQANYKRGAVVLLFWCFLSGVTGIALSYFIHPLLIIFLLPSGLYLPVYLAQKAARGRSQKFSEEYPTLLLATASNMKAGLTVYSSLERAIWLLPADSEVKWEVARFLEQVSRGIPKDSAVRDFAKTIVLPELDLFRRAFALVLSHGGKFSRTLERLAEVCRERENLIKTARVSTASMRMTANVLLGATPVIIGMLSVRNKDFWNILFTHPTASTLGVIGSGIIISSYIVLRRMSDFKP